MLLAKIYLLNKDSKNAKKILISLIEKNDESKNAHKMLAEIYEKEGGFFWGFLLFFQSDFCCCKRDSDRWPIIWIWRCCV